MRPLGSAGSRLTVLWMATVLLAGCAAAPKPDGVSRTLPPPPPAAVTMAAPAAPIDGDLDLRGGPSPVPLQLQIPSLNVNAPVVGVGATPGNVMDAPMGPAGDPVWQQAFWYRGSAVPGALSTALIAGHIGGPGGSSAVFENLGQLQPGDPIVVRDTRGGSDARFAVTESKTYSLDEAADPAVLARIYGAGPIAGTLPQPSADGLSHLSLITCTGTFRDGTHDHRLVVYATRTA